jgi:hypothetical protein
MFRYIQTVGTLKFKNNFIVSGIVITIEQNKLNSSKFSPLTQGTAYQQGTTSLELLSEMVHCVNTNFS